MVLKFEAKKWFVFITSLLLITDLIILLNIPYLRQILGFLCFTIIPGLLILHLLKLNKIEFLKKFVLSVGLSVTLLMFAGLLINSLYPSISKPLSLAPILISFNVILIILAFIAYKRNKDDFDIKDVFNFKVDLKDKLTSPLIFPIIFPFMAVLGTYLMNTQGNNIILLTMLFLIPVYVVSVVYLRDKIQKITYPIAILTISIALLLMHGLTSNYINGSDVHDEYYVFRLTANSLHWDLSNYRHVFNACLNVTILPTVYKSLLGMSGLYIYKLIYQLIWAITPLVSYILFKKYVGELYAFLSSIFFMAQTPFIFTLQSTMRTEIAVFFFALTMMVFFDDKIGALSKKILFLAFMFAVIVSHYSTSYIFFIILFVLYLVTVPMKNLFKPKYALSATIVVLFFAMVFFWYSQLTIGFDNATHFVQNTFINLGNFFVEEMRAQSATAVTGHGVKGISRWIVMVVQDITLVFITVGVISLMRSYKKTKFDIGYISAMVISWGLMASMLIVPYISTGYGTYRTYQQGLVLLAPAFVIGGEVIFRHIRPRLGLLVIIIVLISQFFCATYVIDQIFGNSLSEDLNTKGYERDMLYMYDQEVIAAEWLNVNNADDLKIYTDNGGGLRLLMGCEAGKRPKVKGDFFEKNKTINKGYIYLRYVNVLKGRVYHSGLREATNITDYFHLFVGKNKIYDNSYSEIYQ